MAEIETDLLGVVERITLRPGENATLLPMFEAISNSLFAIEERHQASGALAKGQIRVEVHRGSGPKDNPDKHGPIDGFGVYDNGIGLNSNHFRAFKTPHTRQRIGRGGKGIGRLGWLKVFREIGVKSRFEAKDGSILERHFQFILREQDPLHGQTEAIISSGEPGTAVEMHFPVSPYSGHTFVDPDTVIKRTIGHFLPLIAAAKAPSIIVTDGTTANLKEEFEKALVDQVSIPFSVDINEECHRFEIRHMTCTSAIRPRGRANHWLVFAANDRGVMETPIDANLGIGTLDDANRYIGVVTGALLDGSVQSERTSFSLERDELDTIRRGAVEAAKDYLRDYIDRRIVKQRAVAMTAINENPQYLFLRAEIDNFVNSLKASETSKEDILIAMSRAGARRTNALRQDVDAIISAEKVDEGLTQTIKKYSARITEAQNGMLAEYVVKRKSVLDVLDSLRARDTHGGNHLEDAVHSLVCPMRVTSADLAVEDHNLWILDDRLAFFDFFASDKQAKSYLETTSARRPDIAFLYDSCLAWRENRGAETVVLVEFKQPNKDNYTDSTHPFSQVLDYIELFKTSKTVKDKDGRTISNVGEHTAFHCYIVADLTASLIKRLRGTLYRTPDNKGFFGYTNNPAAFVEVISYDKLLDDARLRNTIFFQKLGLA